MKYTTLLNSTITMLILSGGLCQAATLYQDALPNATNGGVTYANNAAGSNRADISWLSGSNFGTANYFLDGDLFSLGTAANITSITVYEVSNGTAPATGAASASDAPGAEFSSITLDYGTAAAGLTLSSSSYTSTEVYYGPGQTNYQGSSGNYYAIYALTFAVNWNVTAGTLYGFGVDAVKASGTSNALYLAASNVPLSVSSGVTENGASNSFEYWYESGATSGSGTPMDAGACDATCQQQSGFNGSDINVVIAGNSTVPEPGAFALFGLGLAGCIVAARRRRA